MHLTVIICAYNAAKRLPSCLQALAGSTLPADQWDLIVVDNAAEVHALAFRALSPGAACAGRAYFISNGEPLPVREIVNGLLAAAGEPRIEASVPFAVAYAAGALCEALWHTLPLKGEPPMTRFVAEQLATPHWYDLTAARQDFGYVPRVSVEEGLARLARWWREQR